MVISQGNPSKIEIDVQLAPLGVHTIEIESFDSNSSVKSALKSDAIQFLIVAFERPLAIVTAYEFVSSQPPTVSIENI